LPGIVVPTVVLGNGIGRYSRDHVQLNNEVRRGYQEGPVRQYCSVRRHYHVPGYRRPDAEGNHVTRPIHHENQNDRTARTQVLRVDRWLHLGVPIYFPTDVDFEDRIRRKWPVHCSQEMLLRCRTTVIDDIHIQTTYNIYKSCIYYIDVPTHITIYIFLYMYFIKLFGSTYKHI